MGLQHGRSLADASDAELLSLLRQGGTEAYTELWRRHIRAALRLAHQLVPDRADDLASEAFLAVYHQITVSGNGPESAFRAYLFTTMRNAAMRLQREAQLVDTDPDLDEVELNDALSLLEDRARSDEVLEAFLSLPERWQRVLWLTEVEGVKRHAIAAELGIKPNAVSALYRRARAGLRLQWLTLQVPPELRTSTEHVAGRLPLLVFDGALAAPSREVSHHLRQCETCAEIHRDLRSAYARMDRNTLKLAGFAGLGTVLPTASHFSISALSAGASASAFALGKAGVIAAVATLFGVLTLGGVITTTALMDASPHPQQPALSDPGEAVAEEGGGAGDAGGAAPHAGSALVEETGGGSPLGRGNADAAIPSTDFAASGPATDFYASPPRPARASPDAVPPPAAEPAGELGTGLSTPPASSGYLAPVLTGTTAPDASVAVELTAPTSLGRSAVSLFTVASASDGTWAFDLRPVASSMPGDYEFRVWAFTDAESSQPETGRFTLSAPELTGFEQVGTGEIALPFAEAESTGVVFRVVGAPHGTICLASAWSGQSATIALDEHGSAVQRIRFLAQGSYYLVFRACESDYRGPAAEALLDVVDPDDPLTFAPFGPDPELTVFELSDV